ncbi:MAG TPA: hypothetical protein DDZ80_14260, partial [Cyanobacteria bacterium UBA8803]|nr:hypothetical protein [Cyanobacteria bacterium UBA8803]
MLPYILALVIGLGSFAFYMAAFFFPEVHRKNDFIWSGVGLFYALVLWVCAGRITGGVLLGQMASVAVLGWLGWQTLTLRRELASPEQRTEISPQVEAQIKRFSLDGLGSQLLEPLTGLFRKKPVKTIVLRSPETQTTAPKEPTPSVEAPPTDVTTDTQDVAVPVEEEVVVKTYPAEASQEIVEETPPPV